jgi:hypothetical protein
MRPITLSRQLTAADADGIALPQTTAGAADLVLAGAFASGGVARLDAQRKVGVHSTGDINAVVFTIYGTDQSGNQITDTVTGVNNSTVSTVLDFYTVTRVAASAIVGTNVEVGTTGEGASQPIPLDQYLNPFNVSVGLHVEGTVDVTLQYTFDDVFGGAGPFTWYDTDDMDDVVADAEETFISPVAAIRLETNSGDGMATLRILQSGATS